VLLIHQSFSGGAILGDRIRMQQHYLDAGVFIRAWLPVVAMEVSTGSTRSSENFSMRFVRL
jgi:putative protein kinase ArgK-like GTPase of G3E family